MKKKSIGVNAILNGFKTVLSVIFPLITYPYAARVLQVENIGKVNFSNSVVSYFVLIAALGINIYAIREGARVRDDKEKLQQFANEVFSINVISAAFSIIALVICVIIVPKFHDYTLLIAVQSIAIVGNLIGINWLYSIMEDYAYITLRSLIIHIVALVLMFVFVRSEDDYVFYAATTVVATAGANVFNLFHAKKYINLRFTRNMNLKRHLKPIMIIFASTVTSTIYVNSDKTILGFLSDDYHVGLYSTSVNVYTVLKNLISAVILVALPRLSNYIAEGKIDDYKKLTHDIYKMFMMFLLPVIVGIFVTAEPVIRIIAGNSYLDATLSLQILSFSLFFSIIATFYTNAILLPYGQEFTVLKGSIISAVVNLVLNFIAIPLWNQNGAAVTTLIAEFAIWIYQYRYIKNYIRIRVSKRYWTSVICGCLGIIVVSVLCRFFITDFIPNIVATIVISVLTYVIILILFRNDCALAVINQVKEKLHIS